MVEILPIKILRDIDVPIFGSLNVALGGLDRSGLPVGKSFVISSPELHLKTLLEQYDFGNREVFEQSLTLVRKDIETILIPPTLTKEIGKYKFFLVGEREVNYLEKLWVLLLNLWVDEIKVRLWKDGFYLGITENLEPKIVTIINKLEAFGTAVFEPSLDEVVVEVKLGQVKPKDLKKLEEIVREANKKLFMPQKYEWILDKDIKLVKVLPYTPSVIPDLIGDPLLDSRLHGNDKIGDNKRSAVKVFLDLSKTLTVEKPVDGIYIASEHLLVLNEF